MAPSIESAVICEICGRIDGRKLGAAGRVGERNRRAAANSFGRTGLEYGENAALVVSLFGCGVGDECVVAELFDG